MEIKLKNDSTIFVNAIDDPYSGTPAEPSYFGLAPQYARKIRLAQRRTSKWPPLTDGAGLWFGHRVYRGYCRRARHRHGQALPRRINGRFARLRK